MKKLLFILMIATVLVSCGSTRSLNLNRLTTGMTKAEVEAVAGAPDRVLAVNQTDHGYQEVLEYRTSQSEIYALEFWNDYLTGYEFLYDDVVYVPPMAPPMYMPDYGRPIIIVHPDNRPNRPNRPIQPSQPIRPSQPVRPSRPTTRPEVNRPTTRPTQNSRPVTRPATSGGADHSNRTTDRSGLQR